MKKPTLEEIEKILSEPGGEVRINPDGSVFVSKEIDRLALRTKALEEENAKLKSTLALSAEQCRVGDAAFQHLFCEANGKPMPDWVKERLPNLYTILSENAKLREAVKACK